MNVKVKIKLIEGGKIPTYETDGAVCMDCYARLGSDEVRIPPNSRVLVNLGFAVAIPEGYKIEIYPRSGTSFRNNSDVIIGEIDCDYRGELKADLVNEDNMHELKIKNGERICQIGLVEVPKIEFEEVSELPATKRGEGGFGSTGK